MFRLINEAFGVPLHGCKKGKCRVFETFDDAIGRFGDDSQSAAEIVGGLFVIGVDGNLGFANGAADLGGSVERGVVAGKNIADLAVFDWLDSRTNRA